MLATYIEQNVPCSVYFLLNFYLLIILQEQVLVGTNLLLQEGSHTCNFSYSINLVTLGEILHVNPPTIDKYQTGTFCDDI